MAHPGGRPSDYTIELAEEICEQVGNCSLGLKQLCEKNPHWPHEKTIRRWIRTNAEFCSVYAQAKLQRADYMAEEILEIADNAVNDFMEDKDGNKRFDGEHVQRSRLRIDTRKWLACKFAPKVYGEKQDTNIGLQTDLMSKIMDKL